MSILFFLPMTLGAGELCGFWRCEIYQCCVGVVIFGHCQNIKLPGESCTNNVTKMEDANCDSCAPKLKCIDGFCSNYSIGYLNYPQDY
ncbi:hypothetical protein CDAR_66641 [Caerostris darwini]|uniref:Uncharacterized protein n=1 Tax=Caerostris darwini TaxID=1538125 RepID=A0AAV4V6L7_9ARAC|nr:hypothetical protein CDAR_66641 [Caerostris darwini]